MKTQVCFILALVSGLLAKDGAPYYGKLIGAFKTDAVEGDVYAVDARTLFIKGFSFDGQIGDAAFYGGSTAKAGPGGFVIPLERATAYSLNRAYDGEDITLTLPEGRTLKEVRWMAVWSQGAEQALSSVQIPAGFEYPRPQRLSALSGQHQVKSDRIYIVDAQTFLIPNFTYDGQAPDAFFWVGRGSKPNKDGIKIPNESGKLEPLRKYDSKTVVINLPADMTVFDIGYLSVYCRAFEVNFGHIRIPDKLNVPPSLKMLGVAPQAKLNCEVLWDDLALEVRWAVAGETVVLQLVGKLDDRQYIAFGPSGEPGRTRMVGGDVSIGWLDRSTGKGFVHDYYMTSKSQCSGGRGVCKDSVQPNGANNIRLLNAALVNDYVMLTYQRPLKASDEFDRSIITNGTQAVIWAIGPLDEDNEPSYHRLRNKGDLLIDFGRNPEWNCPAPEELPTPLTKEEDQPEERGPQEKVAPQPKPIQTTTVATPTVKPRPWSVPPIECHEPENKVFYAHIGPNGGEQGYSAITGRTGWGISWYINGLLIPEIHVVRGETYTFVVEGGQDPERPARFHPFYISDDPVGGFESKTPAERSKIRIFAGVTGDRDGNPTPVAAGRYCEWIADPTRPADSFASFGAFQRSLKLNCEDGEASVIEWTPDENTPDTVYYNCYTHKNLGWRIRVVDSCAKLGNRRADTAAPAVTVPAPVLVKKPDPVKPAEPEERGSPDDYESDYYDDEDPAGPKSDAAVGSSQNSVVKTNRLPEPAVTMDFDKEFSKFPSNFEDLFSEQPFNDPEIPSGKFPSSGGRIPPHAFEKQPQMEEKPNRNLPRYPEDIDDRNVQVPGPPQDQISQSLPTFGPQPPQQVDKNPAGVKTGPTNLPASLQQLQEPKYGQREPQQPSYRPQQPQKVLPQQPKEVSNAPQQPFEQPHGLQQLPSPAKQPQVIPQQSGQPPVRPLEHPRVAQQPAQQLQHPEGPSHEPQQQPQQPYFRPQHAENEPQHQEEAYHESQQPQFYGQQPFGEQQHLEKQSFGPQQPLRQPHQPPRQPQQPPRQPQQPVAQQQQPDKPIYGLQEPARQPQQPENPSFELQQPLGEQQQPGKPHYGFHEPLEHPQQPQYGPQQFQNWPEQPQNAPQQPQNRPQQLQNGPQQSIRRPQQPAEGFPGPQFQQPERQQPSAQQAPPLQRQQLEKQQLLQAMQSGAPVPPKPKLKSNPKVNFPAPNPPEEIFQRLPGDELRRQQPANFQNVPSIRAPAFSATGIIMEGGFRPIKKSDGIIPALGFEVETVGSHGSSLPTTVRNEPALPSQKPGLVNLDPVFVPSEPEAKEDPKNPVAVPLPIPVVPVVPLSPQGQRPPQQQFPQQPQQQQRPRQPPPPVHRLPHPGPVAIPRPVAQPKPAQSSGFLSFLKFPSFQRRQEQQQPAPSQFHVRQQFRPDDSEPQHQHLEQQHSKNPPPRIQQGPQRNPAAPQQQPSQLDRRPPKPQQLQKPEPNFQSLPKKPSLFSLEGISRIMGMTADRRQEPGPRKPVLPRPAPEQQRPKPADPSKNVPYLPQIKAPLGNPLALLSQGPIPNAFAASLLKGGPLMGLPVGGMKVAITDKEKAQLEKFLFGPSNELRRSGQFPNIIKIVPVPEVAKQRDGRLDPSDGQDETFFDETKEVYAIEVPVADDVNNSTQYIILGSISSDESDLTTPIDLHEDGETTTDEVPTTTEIPQDHHVEKRQTDNDSKPKENKIPPNVDIDDDETMTNRTTKARNSALNVQQPSLFYLLPVAFIYFNYL